MIIASPDIAKSTSLPPGPPNSHGVALCGAARSPQAPPETPTHGINSPRGCREIIDLAPRRAATSHTQWAAWRPTWRTTPASSRSRTSTRSPRGLPPPSPSSTTSAASRSSRDSRAEVTPQRARNAGSPRRILPQRRLSFQIFAHNNQTADVLGEGRMRRSCQTKLLNNWIFGSETGCTVDIWGNINGTMFLFIAIANLRKLIPMSTEH